MKTKNTHCIHCGKKLKRHYKTTYDANEAKSAHFSKPFIGDSSWKVWDGKTYWAYEGLFDTLTCGAAYGARVFNSGSDLITPYILVQNRRKQRK